MPEKFFATTKFEAPNYGYDSAWLMLYPKNPPKCFEDLSDPAFDNIGWINGHPDLYNEAFSQFIATFLITSSIEINYEMPYGNVDRSIYFKSFQPFNKFQKAVNQFNRNIEQLLLEFSSCFPHILEDFNSSEHEEYIRRSLYSACYEKFPTFFNDSSLLKNYVTHLQERKLALKTLGQIFFLDLIDDIICLLDNYELQEKEVSFWEIWMPNANATITEKEFHFNYVMETICHPSNFKVCFEKVENKWGMIDTVYPKAFSKTLAMWFKACIEKGWINFVSIEEKKLTAKDIVTALEQKFILPVALNHQPFQKSRNDNILSEKINLFFGRIPMNKFR